MAWSSPNADPPESAPPAAPAESPEERGNENEAIRWVFLGAALVFLGIGDYVGFSDEGGAYVAGRVIGSALILGVFGLVAWLFTRRANPGRTLAGACLSWPVMLVWLFLTLISAHPPSSTDDPAEWSSKEEREFLRGCRSEVPKKYQGTCRCLLDKVEARWSPDTWVELLGTSDGALPPETEQLVDSCLPEAPFEPEKGRA